MTTALPILAGNVEDHAAKTVELGRDVERKREREYIQCALKKEHLWLTKHEKINEKLSVEGKEACDSERKKERKAWREGVSMFSDLIGGDVRSLEKVSLQPQRNSKQRCKDISHIRDTNIFFSLAFCCFFESLKLLLFHLTSLLLDFEYFILDFSN